MAKTPAQRAAKHGTAATPSTEPVINNSTRRTPQKAQGNVNLFLIASSVASLFLFAYFHLLTLNQMKDLSGGLAMPQSFVFGFDMAHVEALRLAMDADALGQLNYVGKTAGTLFPLLFAITALTMIASNVAKRPLRWALWVLPLAFAAISLWANAAVDSMMAAQKLDPGAVTLASGLVTASWMLLIATLLAIGLALFLGRKKKVTPAAS